MALVPETQSNARPHLQLTDGDLRRLAIIAQMDREEFFAEHPRWRRLYGDRLLCSALCQGAAEHYLDGTTGIRDFDVWSFYREHPDAPFPYRRKRVRPFGDRRFGRCLDRPAFEGRPVDLVGRSIASVRLDDPGQAVVRYLRAGATRSARALRERPVVLLEPAHRRGEIVWPESEEDPGCPEATSPKARQGRWRRPPRT